MYQDKDNFEKQISIVKGTEKFFWKGGKLFRKGIYLTELSFFPLLFLKKKIQSEHIPPKNRKIYSTQYPAKQPYYQFVN